MKKLSIYTGLLWLVLSMSGCGGGGGGDSNGGETGSGPDTQPPTANISPGASQSYSKPQLVTLGCSDDSDQCTVYYTLDGTDPVGNGKLYSGPFTLVQDTTVRFYAVDDAQGNGLFGEDGFDRNV